MSQVNSKPEVIIVGAGAAGAMLAYKLAQAGRRVLVIESGPERGHRQEYIDRYYSAPAKTPDSPYPGWPLREAGGAPSPSVLDLGPDWREGSTRYLQQTGNAPLSSTYVRLGGGTLNHWNGVCLRHLPTDFELHRRYGVEGAVDWPLTYEDLEPYYGQVEHEIGVAGDHSIWDGLLGARRSTPFPMGAIPQSHLDGELIRRLNGRLIQGQTLRILPTPQARNSRTFDDRPRCMGNTSCVPICPIQAKYDATVHLAKAVRAGAEVLYQAVAHRVHVDPADDRVTSVDVVRWTRSVEQGLLVERQRLSARLFVLCAHAIETPKLLLNSPWRGELTVANSSDAVGRHLMDKPTLVSWALSNSAVHPFRGPLSTSIINEFRDGPHRRDHAAYVMDVGNDGASWADGAPYSTIWDLVQKEGLFGRALRERAQYLLSRQINFTAEFESLPDPENRVTLSAEFCDELGIPRPRVRFNLDDYTRRGFAHAWRTHQEIFRAVGVLGDPIAMNTPGPGEAGVFEFGGQRFKLRGAGHLLGTYRMGSDARRSVVAPDCRSHDHRNLFMLGSGVFPASGTANPTMTILALTLRAAEVILQELSPPTVTVNHVPANGGGAR